MYNFLMSTIILSKMKGINKSPVQYFLNQSINLNSYIGQEVSIEFTGIIFCSNCNRKIKKTFFNGLCFPCFKSSPEASECIIKPELCEAHLGRGRDIEWEKKNHLVEHYVYLSATSHIKVGVTRFNQIPSRWIDQGATLGILFCKTPNRYLAGCIEVALKSIISDKTAWQKMLKSCSFNLDLLEKKSELSTQLDSSLKNYFVNDNTITEIKYPILKYPNKIRSISLDKTPNIKSTLIGIKGQYLIFNDDYVFNVRKHSGYEVKLN